MQAIGRTALGGRHSAISCSPYNASVFLRESGEESLLIALNLAETPHDDIAMPPGSRGRVLLSSELDRDEAVEGRLMLRPTEAVIVAMESWY